MKTELAPELLLTPEGQEADRILRSCVHCGFCASACPTYQVLGDELDGPRGRIYLIKELLEGSPASDTTRQHLDRCLTCQSCETACPSGVEYHKLLNIGRAHVEQANPRSLGQRVVRWLARTLLPQRNLMTLLVRSGQAIRWLAPGRLKQLIPARQPLLPKFQRHHPRRMLMLKGCVQPGLSPNINAATRIVLDKLGIEATEVEGERCCGALSFHLNDQDAGLAMARHNIDIWWPHLAAGAEAIIMTASGCGQFVKDYAYLLREDPHYRDKAQTVVDKVKDISEILSQEDIAPIKLIPSILADELAFHCPCTLQHGQQLGEPTQTLLQQLGFNLQPVADSHLCCGSAGTYSLFQPELSRELKQRKLTALQKGQPKQIISANIGCIHHLQGGTQTPVSHWIELVAKHIRHA